MYRSRQKDSEVRSLLSGGCLVPPQSVQTNLSAKNTEGELGLVAALRALAANNNKSFALAAA